MYLSFGDGSLGLGSSCLSGSTRRVRKNDTQSSSPRSLLLRGSHKYAHSDAVQIGSMSVPVAADLIDERDVQNAFAVLISAMCAIAFSVLMRFSGNTALAP